MISAISLWLARNKLAAGLGVTLLLIATHGGAYWKGRTDEGAAVRLRSAAAEGRQDARKATADGRAAIARERSEAATTRLEEDLKRADDTAPNARPSRARLLAACEFMRQQGADPAAVARCLAVPTRD